MNDDNYEDRGRRIFEMEIQELQKVSASLNGSFTEAVSMLRQCLENRGKIVVVGIGSSFVVGRCTSLRTIMVGWWLGSFVVQANATDCCV